MKLDLSTLTHGLLISQHDEMICGDGTNPRHNVLSAEETSKVELVVKRVPWYNTHYLELMARYQDRDYEIGLCEHCLERIICFFLEQQTQ